LQTSGVRDHARGADWLAADGRLSGNPADRAGLIFVYILSSAAEALGCMPYFGATVVGAAPVGPASCGRMKHSA